MRFKKTILFSFIILVTFLTYLYFHDSRVHYVVLGDSLAAGQNPYGEMGYGYADYIAEYLNKEDLLNSYIKDFAVSGYTTVDVLRDLEHNKKVMIDGVEFNLRKVLRESDLVTISVGANDFLKDFNLDELDLEHPDAYAEKILKIVFQVEDVLENIRKYAKGKIILVGYYNPFPLLAKNYGSQIDQLFRYIDEGYLSVCSLHDVDFISVYELFKTHSDYLPNPFDIHPNIQGYQAMGQAVIDQYLKK